MRRKKYVTPDMEVEIFDLADVIVTSPYTPEDDVNAAITGSNDSEKSLDTP